MNTFIGLGLIVLFYSVIYLLIIARRPAYSSAAIEKFPNSIIEINSKCGFEQAQQCKDDLDVICLQVNNITDLTDGDFVVGSRCVLRILQCYKEIQVIEVAKENCGMQSNVLDSKYHEKDKDADFHKKRRKKRHLLNSEEKKARLNRRNFVNQQNAKKLAHKRKKRPSISNLAKTKMKGALHSLQQDNGNQDSEENENNNDSEKMKKAWEGCGSNEPKKEEVTELNEEKPINPDTNDTATDRINEKLQTPGVNGCDIKRRSGDNSILKILRVREKRSAQYRPNGMDAERKPQVKGLS